MGVGENMSDTSYHCQKHPKRMEPKWVNNDSSDLWQKDQRKPTVSVREAVYFLYGFHTHVLTALSELNGLELESYFRQKGMELGDVIGYEQKCESQEDANHLFVKLRSRLC